MTVWLRLGSLSAPDFRDRFGFSCETHHEPYAIESPTIVWTSFIERPAEFEPIKTNSALAFPFRNSTFKRT